MESGFHKQASLIWHTKHLNLLSVATIMLIYSHKDLDAYINKHVFGSRICKVPIDLGVGLVDPQWTCLMWTCCQLWDVWAACLGQVCAHVWSWLAPRLIWAGLICDDWADLVLLQR